MSGATVAVETTRPAAAASESAGFWRRLLRRPLGAVCTAYLGIVVGLAIVAPLALPGVGHEPYWFGDFNAIGKPPSWHHLLGTDFYGRDILERLLVGAQPTMLGVAEAMLVVLTLGVPIGLAAGFLGGWFDALVVWLTDLSLAFPGLIIVIVAAAFFQGNLLAAMVTLGFVLAPGLARVVRAATLPFREELFVLAGRVSGLSRAYIVRRELLPRIAGVVIVQASLTAGTAMLIQGGLAFLRLVPLGPRSPSWGNMIANGAALIGDPWIMWPPGILLTITGLAFVLFGNIARDVATEQWSAAPAQGAGRRGRPHQRTALGRRLSSRAPRAAAETEAQALLGVESLSVGFFSSTGTNAVVENVSFDVQAGETVGLMGESGCGKTMTAMAMLGLLPGTGRITGGRIVFDGRDLAVLSERDLRKIRGKEIGFISQDPMVSLTPVYRVGWQLAEVVRCHHDLTRAEARRRALTLLDRVQLPNPERVAERFPHELSGGMAQRVALAAALAGNPKLLVADEPTTALDVTVQAEILELLRELQRDTGMAVLLITHDGGVIADSCERVVVMYAGQIVERGQTETIFEQPLHPYTQALLRSNPQHFTNSSRLPTIRGSVPEPGAWPTGCHFHPRCAYAVPACRQQPIALQHPSGEREPLASTTKSSAR